MIATSYETFLRLFREKSLILSYDPEKNRRPNERPRSSRSVDLSLKGIQRLLTLYLDEELLSDDCPRGVIPALRLALKQANKEWAAFASANSSAKTLQPSGVFLEKINKTRAQLQVAEEECRKLNKLLKLREKERTDRPMSAKHRLRLARAGKIVNGRLVEMGGRSVTRNEQGEDVFKDGSGTVADYLASLPKRTPQKAKNPYE